MTEKELLHYWDYFRSLVLKFSNTQQYVDHTMTNRGRKPLFENRLVYSNEFLQLFLSACAEFETVAKMICVAVDPGFDAESDHNIIINITKSILMNYPQIGQTKLRANQYEFMPLQKWSVEWYRDKKDNEMKEGVRGLDWWTKHNRLKHERFRCAKEANLENCFYAMASLFVLELLLIRTNVDSLHFFLSRHPCTYFRCPEYEGKHYLLKPDSDLPGFQSKT